MALLREHDRPEDLLAGFEEYLGRRGPDFFRPDAPITAARAPARIDCMGGIADYSGSVVFEGTLNRAAVVAVQPREDTLLRARSDTFEREGRPFHAEFNMRDMRDEAGALKGYDALRALFAQRPDDAWAAYVLGALPVLENEGACRFPGGADMLVWSDIPIGVGVASSAALEVAAMYAAVSAAGCELAEPRLAALAQTVENRVVGAPCGIMDQVTSALGEVGKLLALRCRPCDLMGQHRLPAGVRVFGLSSRVQHRIAGAAYARARVGAFMGLKVILTQMERRGRRTTEAARYLCALSPRQYREQFRDHLPEQMTGAEFLRAYGETTDAVTRIEPEVVYAVRACTDHPIFENYRVQAFMDCMERAREGDRTALVEAGGLMYASHWSYGWNCGLGCPQTDLIVELVRVRGPQNGFYGAKITGGGSGGTVAVLAEASAGEELRRIGAEYEERTGLEPDIFDGTSPGACAFGPRTYRLTTEAPDG